MEFQFWCGPRQACIFACCHLLALAPAIAGAENMQMWQSAASLSVLVDHLDDWLDENSDLPARADPPEIRFVAGFSQVTLSASNRLARTDAARGFYDPDRQTIWLVPPWDRNDPFDVSVLVHEQMHHRQAAAGHWYCPAAQELPAYRMQQKWLAQWGLEPNVNWVAVVLEAGCTPRDIHPD